MRLFNFPNIISDFSRFKFLLASSIDDSSAKIFSCLNPHSVFSSLFSRKAFHSYQTSFNVIDGIGFAVLARILYFSNLERVTGLMMTDYFFHLYESRFGHIAFVGSDLVSLDKIRRFVSRSYGVDVFCYSPPYKECFSQTDISDISVFLKSNNIKFVFFGLTAPKQEILAQQVVGIHPSSLIVFNVGAVFDYFAGNIVLPPRFFRNFGLEWVWRLYTQPSHVWRRVFVSFPVFFLYSICYRIIQLFRNLWR